MFLLKFNFQMTDASKSLIIEVLCGRKPKKVKTNIIAFKVKRFSLFLEFLNDDAMLHKKQKGSIASWYLPHGQES